MQVYINALGASNHSHVNCRAAPDINSRVEWYLTSIGVIAEYIQENEKWVNYNYNGKDFWVHKDVHDYVELKEHVITTDYVSQNDADSSKHPNDCGLASLSILMRNINGFDRSVNDLASDIQLIGRDFVSFNQLIYLAKKHNYSPEYFRPLHMSKILKSVYQNIPVLMLVNYDKLIRGKNYGHFLVVVGYDGDIITHDPNTRAYMRYSVQSFAEAIAQLGTGSNMPFQGMYLKGKKK
jgi:hypothetical protein